MYIGIFCGDRVTVLKPNVKTCRILRKVNFDSKIDCGTTF